MKLIKPKGILIGKEKFQLINPRRSKSREININSRSKNELCAESQEIVDMGFSHTEWAHTGTEACITQGLATQTHQLFINLLNKNPKAKKNVLVIGPGKGYEIENIKKNVKNSIIDSFDIVDAVKDNYKSKIKNLLVDAGGIENLVNKNMIGKYDGITAVYSAGYHTNHLERNILKISLMLRPKGVALIKLTENTYKLLKFERNMPIILKKFKLTNQFKIDRRLIDNGKSETLIITRK